MTLSQIEIFVELAKEKNFSRTAEKLGITQSAVSHAIKKLEQDLGVYLVSRERKNFQFTEMGANLLIYCREIQQQVRNIKLEVKAQKLGTKGSIRLGTVWSVAHTILPKLLNAYKRKHPTVDILVFEGTDPEIEKWLFDQVIDVGIYSRHNQQLEQTKLTEDRFFAAVADDHPLSNKKILCPEHLGKYPFIMSTGGCEPLIRSIVDFHQTTLNVRYQAREIISIVSMVKANLGVSLIPELAIPKDFEGVRFIPLKTTFRRAIFLGTLKRGCLRKHINDFIRHVEASRF